MNDITRKGKMKKLLNPVLLLSIGLGLMALTTIFLTIRMNRQEALISQLIEGQTRQVKFNNDVAEKVLDIWNDLYHTNYYYN